VLDGRLIRRHLTPVKATVSTKGQLVLPAEIRQQDGIKPVAPPPNEGPVDWLLSCPEKGYFVAIDSESTDYVWSKHSSSTLRTIR
jgi:hypothetical protein